MVDYSLAIVPGISPAARHRLEDKLDVFLEPYGGESTGGGTMLDGSGSDLDFACAKTGFEAELELFLLNNANVDASFTLTNLETSEVLMKVDCARSRRWWEFWK